MHPNLSKIKKAFLYESRGEHHRALRIWKQESVRGSYPNAQVRAAEILRNFNCPAWSNRYLQAIDSAQIIDEYGVIFGENLLLQWIEIFGPIELPHNFTQKILAQNWEQGGALPKEFEDTFRDLNLSSFSVKEDSEIILEELKHGWTLPKPQRLYSRCSFQVEANEIEDAYAKIGSNAIVTKDFFFVDEFRRGYPRVASCEDDPLVAGISGDRALIKIDKNENIVERTKAFWLAIKYGDEFGHFINTLLTRIRYFELHPEWGSIPAIVSKNLTKTQMDFLLVLFPGIEFEAFDHASSLSFKKLIYAPTSVFSPATVKTRPKPPEWVFINLSEFKWLYERMRSICEPTEKTRKIAVVRRDLDRRKCENSTMWEKLAARFGYELIDPSKMTAKEQIQMFHEATDIIGEIGSWIYLAGMNHNVRLTLLSHPDTYQWWSEISQLNKILKRRVFLLSGRCNNGTSYKYGDVNSSWRLPISKLLLIVSRLSIDFLKSNNWKKKVLPNISLKSPKGATAK
jgi:hypothetical protein